MDTKKTPKVTKKVRIKTKDSNTKVASIEKKYKVDLNVRSDMKLGNFLKQKGYPSLSRMLKK